MSFSVGSSPWGMPPGPAQPQLHPSMALPPTGVPSGMPPAAFNYPPPNPMLAPPPGKALYHLQLSSCPTSCPSEIRTQCPLNSVNMALHDGNGCAT